MQKIKNLLPSLLIIAFFVLVISVLFLGEDQKEESKEVQSEQIREVPAGNSDEYHISIVYHGELYSGMFYNMEITQPVEYAGTISNITPSPTKELESTKGTIGQNVYVFSFEGKTCLLLEKKTEAMKEGAIFGAVVGLAADQVEKLVELQ